MCEFVTGCLPGNKAVFVRKVLARVAWDIVLHESFSTILAPVQFGIAQGNSFIIYIYNKTNYLVS